MKSSVTLTLVMGVLLAIASCRKQGCTDPLALNHNSEANKDDGTCTYPEATFTFTNPAGGVNFDLGDTVHIEGTITASDDMQGYQITLANTSVSSMELSISSQIQSSSYMIDTFWVNNVSQHSDMILDINVDMDTLGNADVHSISFHCHPM